MSSNEQSGRWFLNMPVSVNTIFQSNRIHTHFLEVINQMDTSQAHLSSRPTSTPNKPDNLSKEELTAVLKYGAQKMYVCEL